MLDLLAILAGSIYGKLHDPFAWLFIAFAVFFGLSRMKVWTPLALSFAATAVNVALVYSWWVEVGLGWRNHAVLRILLVYLILNYTAYAIGRLIEATCRRLEPGS